jgi:hypothetical protein
MDVQILKRQKGVGLEKMAKSGILKLHCSGTDRRGATCREG